MNALGGRSLVRGLDARSPAGQKNCALGRAASRRRLGDLAQRRQDLVEVVREGVDVRGLHAREHLLAEGLDVQGGQVGLARDDVLRKARASAL